MRSADTSTRIQIELSITLKTPLCVGAAGSGSGIADKFTQRDGWNRPIIPGSQIKGRIRHTCERIAVALEQPVCGSPYPGQMCPDYQNISLTRTAIEQFHIDRAEAAGHKISSDKILSQCLICAIFGSAIYPSPLLFSDAVHIPTSQADPPGTPIEIHQQFRPGVGIDRHRRTALENAFYIVETTMADITFTSSITGRWRNTPQEQVRGMVGLLVLGAKATARWGGGSARGLGWSDVTVGSVILNDEVQTLSELEKGVKTLCTGS